MSDKQRFSADGMSANGDCCSSRERIWLMKGGERVEQPERRGWKISEVERLVGLSRRDIQHCCYSGAGGVGVLTPSDGGWGRRTYDERDLAMLFLVAERRREGLTLSQAARQLNQELEEHSLTDLLEADAMRLRDQLDELFGRLVHVEAFSAALDDDLRRELRLRELNERLGALGDVTAEQADEGAEFELPGVELLQELMKEREG